MDDSNVTILIILKIYLYINLYRIVKDLGSLLSLINSVSSFFCLGNKNTDLFC